MDLDSSKFYGITIDDSDTKYSVEGRLWRKLAELRKYKEIKCDQRVLHELQDEITDAFEKLYLIGIREHERHVEKEVELGKAVLEVFEEFPYLESAYMCKDNEDEMVRESWESPEEIVSWAKSRKGVK